MLGAGPLGVVVPIFGHLEMQVAKGAERNVLGRENGPKTAVVVPFISIECESSPPFIIFESH
jgi:hypothetical protein